MHIWRDFDEENEFRIADIFHDVAKGQVLETFVDYAKSLFEEEDALINEINYPKVLYYNEMYQLLQVSFSSTLIGFIFVY